MPTVNLNSRGYLVNTNTPTPTKLNIRTIQRRRAQKAKLVMEWLANLPMHWEFEEGIAMGQKGTGVVDGHHWIQDVSDVKQMGGSTGGWFNEMHAKVHADLEQRLKLVGRAMPMSMPLRESSMRKRKRSFIDQLGGGDLVGGNVNANMDGNVKVDKTKNEMAMDRPVKKMKKAIRNVVVTV